MHCYCYYTCTVDHLWHMHKMHSNNYIFQTAWIIFSLRHNHWQNCPGRFTWIQHNTKLNKRAVCYNRNTILKYILNRIKWNKTIRCTVAEHQHRRLSFHFSYTQWKTKTLAVNVEHATYSVVNSDSIECHSGFVKTFYRRESDVMLTVVTC